MLDSVPFETPAAPPEAAAAAVAPATPETDGAPTITWVEPGEGFLHLSLRNLALTIATGGAYHFWGRAEARQRIYAAVHIDGKPLAYTGTGREGFIGFLIALAVVALVIGGAWIYKLLYP